MEERLTGKNNVAAIILAAGLGTRMKSKKAKVLHEVIGRPMILYVVETARKVAGDDVVLVVGYQARIVQDIVSQYADVYYSTQKEQLGTGHAVLCAVPVLSDHIEQVIILYGDVPVLTHKTVLGLLDDHVKAKRDLSDLAEELGDPRGYGRILIDENGQVRKIVEEADATAVQKRIKMINTGIYCVKKEFLIDSIQKIRSDNAQGEFYLTDIIEIGCREGKDVGVVVGNNPDEVMGVNSFEDLQMAERVMYARQGEIS